MVNLDDPITPVQTVGERIKQRRYQILVHSYLYYELDDPIISDHQWQLWANELRDLQAVYGYQIGFYDNEFKDWTGATGYHLPKPAHIQTKARRLLCK